MKTKFEAPPRREGFWRSSYEESLPMPVTQVKPWDGRGQFLADLESVEQRLRPDLYKGWSTCRCCGCPNGSAEFKAEGWEWPEGFKHYVAEHNVRPSLAFQEFIREYAAFFSRFSN